MRRGAGRQRISAAAVLGACTAALMSVATVSASSASTEDCVAQRVADGESRAEALATCLREAGETTETTVVSSVPGGGLDTGDTSSPAADDDGTSPVLLIVVGVVGALIGAAGATLIARRSRGGRTAPVAAASTPASGLQPPAPPTSPPSDRSPALIESLIDLSDRMTSQALRAEIIATLGRAGVHPIEIAPGTAFEATTMRGIGSSPTSDPAWVGRVATTDRCGFHDAGRIIRLPDVVVYVAG